MFDTSFQYTYNPQDLKGFPAKVDYYCLTNGKASFFDFHYNPEIGIIIEGEMEREYNGTKFLCSPNCSWFSGIWEPHGYTIVKAPCKLVVIVLDPVYFSLIDMPYINYNNIFSVSAEKKMSLNENSGFLKDNEVFAQKYLSLCGEINELKFVDLKLTICANILNISKYLAFNFQSNILVSDNKVNEIQKAIDFVFKNKRFIPVEEAADFCNMNKKKFSKLFLETMGLSFSKFALMYRTKAAANKLLLTNDTIDSISFEWGFNDISHFSNCFVSLFGIKPSEYRKRKGKEYLT